MSAINDWKTEPTVLYGRKSRHQQWKLLFVGSGLAVQAYGDRWREDVFDYSLQIIGETLTMRDLTGDRPAKTLPRNY